SPGAKAQPVRSVRHLRRNSATGTRLQHPAPQFAGGQRRAPPFGACTTRRNAARRDLVLPSNDGLYTSGTLGNYCAKLKETVESGTTVLKPMETGTAAD